MNMKDQLSVLAYFFCILNGLFLIIGFLQMGFGMWILYDKNSFFTALVYADPQNNIMMDIAYTLLCTGVFIIVPFAVGYLGIIKESRCLLILYIVIIAQMAILQFSMIILILLQKNNIMNKMISNFELLIFEYGDYSLYEEKKHSWELLNIVQSSNYCCGISNSSDWEMNAYVAESQKMPCSCTNTSLKKWFCEPSLNEINIKGCKNAFTIWFFVNMNVLVSIEFGLLILEIALLLITVFLLKIVKKKTTVFIAT